MSREQLHHQQKEKQQQEKDFQETLKTQKDEFNRLQDEYKSKASVTDENSKEMQRRVMSAESEFEKQKALLDQKIEFLEK
jgi:hypothetical protein